MIVNRQQLDEAVAKGIIDGGQADALQQFLSSHESAAPTLKPVMCTITLVD